jgi:hypothetical protein
VVDAALEVRWITSFRFQVSGLKLVIGQRQRGAETKMTDSDGVLLEADGNEEDRQGWCSS